MSLLDVLAYKSCSQSTWRTGHQGNSSKPPLHSPIINTKFYVGIKVTNRKAYLGTDGEGETITNFKMAVLALGNE